MVVYHGWIPLSDPILLVICLISKGSSFSPVSGVSRCPDFHKSWGEGGRGGERDQGGSAGFQLILVFEIAEGSK